MTVVYFDQQTGAPQAFRWSKSFFDAKASYSVFFPSQMEKKKGKPKKIQEKHFKYALSSFFPFVTEKLVLA